MDGGSPMTLPSQVCFSHGQESGPWGTKIRGMADTSRSLGWDVASLDYQGVTDPLDRVTQLRAHCEILDQAPVLVGSSMGGFVSLAAAAQFPVRGIFLLAPALYLPGYAEHLPVPPDCPTQIIHGWHDEVVPWASSVRWGEHSRARVLLLDGDHRLTDNLSAIQTELAGFLRDLVRE